MVGSTMLSCEEAGNGKTCHCDGVALLTEEPPLLEPAVREVAAESCEGGRGG
jgi:hypothetical protein